ncbi:hypothetical protein Slin15195_G040500 [Septoria linicola]|uniref:Uncharacterized protein n=1 Tax=Septoria linicola TaxID=215465 RepID=A0A9Q9EGE3_9PEZI|nr:hypothetical protein Slin14017_G044030 [Septoria linicola]USW50731.1 hypothetical protein Slin15195_G040500 [Septoria linicola]
MSDNVFPSNMPIPRAFAADFDKFRTRPHITGMADLEPASEPLLIKVGRTTEISVGRVGASRQEHSINESDDSIPETHDYAVFPGQAGRAVGYFGDSGAGLYTSDGKLSAILVAGDDSNMLETPFYIMPIQLVQARMRPMGYELDICPPGMKAEIRLDAADKYGTIKGSSKKNRNKLKKERKAEEEKLEMQASARQTEEARIASEAAPDGTNGVVLGIDSNEVDERRVYRVRLSPTGDVKSYSSSMLGLTWQPAVQAFWSTVREDQRMSAVATGVSSLQLTGRKGKEKKK